jgi:hypothetical protein
LSDGRERGLAAQRHLRRNAGFLRQQALNSNTRFFALSRDLQGAEIIALSLRRARGGHGLVERCLLLGRERFSVLDSEEGGDVVADRVVVADREW